MLEIQTGGGKPIVTIPKPTTTKTTTSTSTPGATSSASGKTSTSTASKSSAPPTTTATQVAAQPKPTAASASSASSSPAKASTPTTVISAATSARLHAIQPTGVDTAFDTASSSFATSELAFLAGLEPGRSQRTQARVTVPIVRAAPASKRTVPTQSRQPVVPAIKRVAQAAKDKSSPPVDHTVRGLPTTRALASSRAQSEHNAHPTDTQRIEQHGAPRKASGADYARAATSSQSHHESPISASNRRASAHSETLNHAIDRMLAQGYTTKQVSGEVKRWHPDWSPARVTSAMRAAGNPGASLNTNLHRAPTARVSGTPEHASAHNTPRPLPHWEPANPADENRPKWQATPYYPGQKPTGVGRGLLYKNPEQPATISEMSTVGLTPAQLAYMHHEHDLNSLKFGDDLRWIAQHPAVVAAVLATITVGPEIDPFLLAASDSFTLTSAGKAAFLDHHYTQALVDITSVGAGRLATSRLASEAEQEAFQAVKARAALHAAEHAIATHPPVTETPAFLYKEAAVQRHALEAASLAEERAEARELAAHRVAQALAWISAEYELSH